METVKRAALAALRAYQSFISPLLPPACRFYPTCSCYMYEAITQHGTVRGVYLGVKRLLRCHPFHPGGYDPVPDRIADVDKLFARFQAVKRPR